MSKEQSVHFSFNTTPIPLVQMRNSTSSKQAETHVNKNKKKEKKKEKKKNQLQYCSSHKKVHLQINKENNSQINPKQTAGMKMSRQSPSFSFYFPLLLLFFFFLKPSVLSILMALWPHGDQTVPRARVQRAWLFFVVRLPS